METLTKFCEWDTPRTVSNGSHQQIFLCLLSASYAAVALISLFLFFYKLLQYLHHKTWQGSGDVKIGNNDDFMKKMALSFFVCFLIASLIRSVGFGFMKSHLLFRNLTVYIPTVLFFVVYNAIMRCIWDTHSSQTRSDNTDAVAAASKMSSLLKTGRVILYTCVYIYALVSLCQALQVLDGISLYGSRLFMQLSYLAGTIWLQAQEFATCLSYEKDGAFEVSVWQAIFSRSQTLKKARKGRPPLLRLAVFLGIYSLLLKLLFTANFMFFYQFDKHILPVELDDATGFAIGNLFYFLCTEIVPFSLMIYLTACDFRVTGAHAQEKYLPLQNTEV